MKVGATMQHHLMRLTRARRLQALGSFPDAGPNMHGALLAGCQCELLPRDTAAQASREVGSTASLEPEGLELWGAQRGTVLEGLLPQLLLGETGGGRAFALGALGRGGEGVRPGELQIAELAFESLGGGPSPLNDLL